MKADPLVLGFDPRNVSNIYVNTTQPGRVNFILVALSLGSSSPVRVHFDVLIKTDCVISNATSELFFSLNQSESNATLPSTMNFTAILLAASREQLLNSKGNCGVVEYVLMQPNVSTTATTPLPTTPPPLLPANSSQVGFDLNNKSLIYVSTKEPGKFGFVLLARSADNLTHASLPVRFVINATAVCLQDFNVTQQIMSFFVPVSSTGRTVLNMTREQLIIPLNQTCGARYNLLH